MKDILRVALTFVAGLVVVFASALTYSRAHGTRVPTQASKRAHFEKPKSPVNSPVPTVLKEGPPESSSEAAMPSNANSAANHILGSRSTPDSTTTVQVAKRELGAPMPPLGSALTNHRPIQERTRTEISVPAAANSNVANAETYSAPPQSEPIQPVIRELPSTAAQDQRHAPEQQAEYRSAEQPHQITGAITGAAPQPNPEPVASEPRTKVITVQPGTTLAVRVSETLSSDHNRTGNTFPATLASPLVVNGSLVARAGSTVFGRVVNARKAPVIGGRSELILALTNVTTADGKLVRIDTSTWEEKGAHSSIVNTAKMATGAAVGAVVGAVKGAAEGAGLSSALQNGDQTNGFMATKRTVVLPAGTQIVFSLATPFTTTEKLNPEVE